nr:reverse transcriptase domain-containing protein [Tanacetum cinerariifolium]
MCIRIPQSNVSSSVADEAINKEMHDGLGRANTTTSTLEAKQGSGDSPVQARPERLSNLPNEPPLREFESDTEYVYDDPFDSKGEKIKEFKLLIDELDLPRSSDFLPSPEYDSFSLRIFPRLMLCLRPISRTKYLIQCRERWKRYGSGVETYGGKIGFDCYSGYNSTGEKEVTVGNDDTCFSIDVIDEILEEDFDALLDEGSKIFNFIEGTILEEKLFAEFNDFMAMTVDENSEFDSDTEEPPLVKITFNTNYKIKTSLEEPLLDLELKPLHDNLEYHKIELIDNKKPVVQKQRRLNPNMQEVIKKKSLNFSRLVSFIQSSIDLGCMIAIFHDMIKKSVEVFMDDFLVFGNSFDNYLKNLNKMLQRCNDANLVLSWEKYHFMVKEGIVLGQRVFGAGLEVDKAKINVISKLLPPTNVKGIKSFLRHAGFYRRFIKHFLRFIRPLTKFFEKDTPFEFNDKCHKAFNSLEEQLTCTLVIMSLNWNLPFELMCDASDFAVGAILGQKDGKHFYPIYFASKTLNATQQKYTVTEKELMVVVFAFDKFQAYLKLSKTIVYIDHSALRHLFKKQDVKPCLIRWILLLQEFNIELKYKKGTKNVAAKHLSQIDNDETSDDSDVDNNFSGETLMEITTDGTAWFADFANYLVGDVIPKGMTYQQKNKFFSDLKNYFWEDPYLFKVCSDGMIEHCVSGPETHTILDQCHHRPSGGYYRPNTIAKKVLDSGFY